MRAERGRSARIAAIVLVVVLLATGVAAGAGRSTGKLDPSFGDGGRTVVSLPPAFGEGSFGPVAPTANGGLLVAYVVKPKERGWFGAIARLLPSGALDPSFGEGGWVAMGHGVDALAEDASGGVLYAGTDGFGRLQPNGARDEAFDARAVPPEYLELKSIAVGPQGQIVVSGTNPAGPRYHPHESETGLMRFAADGTPDRTFGFKGVLYLGFTAEGSEAVFLPDGSMIVGGSPPRHVAADGTVAPAPDTIGGADGVAVFPDGSFAVTQSHYKEAGCTVTRYAPDWSIDKSFGQGGTIADPRLFECLIAAAPGGGLLVGGTTGAEGEGPPRLTLLTAAGTPATDFGDGGSVGVSVPAEPLRAEPLTLESLVVSSSGRIIVGGSAGDDAVLVGLKANGEVDPAFGSGGTVVEAGRLPSWTRPVATAAEPNGELIVTGVTDSGGTVERPFWMRFGADGKLIPTSSGAAFAPDPALGTLLLPSGSGSLYALVDDHRGKIAKLEPDGSLVAGFGRHGWVGMPPRFKASSFVVDPDGGVTVLGAVGFGRRMAAYRLTATGRPDRRFGHRGLARVPVGHAKLARAMAGAHRPGGDLVIAGVAEKGLAVAELGPDGRLRRGFGDGGILRCDCGGSAPKRVRVVVHGADTYVLDQWEAGFHEGVDLVAVNAAGRLDRSFAGKGRRRIGIHSTVGFFVRGGRLVVVGQRANDQGPSRVLAFHLDGRPDRAFKAGGSADAGYFVQSGLLSAALQPDGRLVLVGEGQGGTEVEPPPLQLVGLR